MVGKGAGGNGDRERMIQQGIDAGEADMCREDRIWSEYSSDKVDISRVLMQVIGDLHRSRPPEQRMRALSLGSGPEPQFQILQSAFSGGLFLVDIDGQPLARLRRDVRNRCIDNVVTIRGDYTQLLSSHDACSEFLDGKLEGQGLDLITMHHSLYYCPVSSWRDLFSGMTAVLLKDGGAIHAVMMSPSCRERNTTAWLYQHFAGEFLHRSNDQDLAAFGRENSAGWERWGWSVEVATHRVRFFVKDFRKLMSVVWMILLYPEENSFDPDQRREITEYVYREFWIPGEPLYQLQDHLVLRI